MPEGPIRIWVRRYWESVFTEITGLDSKVSIKNLEIENDNSGKVHASMDIASVYSLDVLIPVGSLIRIGFSPVENLSTRNIEFEGKILTDLSARTVFGPGEFTRIECAGPMESWSTLFPKDKMLYHDAASMLMALNAIVNSDREWSRILYHLNSLNTSVEIKRDRNIMQVLTDIIKDPALIKTTHRQIQVPVAVTRFFWDSGPVVSLEHESNVQDEPVLTLEDDDIISLDIESVPKTYSEAVVLAKDLMAKIALPSKVNSMGRQQIEVERSDENKFNDAYVHAILLVMSQYKDAKSTKIQTKSGYPFEVNSLVRVDSSKYNIHENLVLRSKILKVDKGHTFDLILGYNPQDMVDFFAENDVVVSNV